MLLLYTIPTTQHQPNILELASKGENNMNFLGAIKLTLFAILVVMIIHKLLNKKKKRKTKK
tara:strand:+ start:1874 stop:2056 length:183 start_codon:yes stop_codon:yes gene_type:complete